MAGQEAGGRGIAVSMGIAGIIVIGCFALGMLLGTIGTTNSSGSNLRHSNEVNDNK